jgi:nucleoid-associated protein YgaU
MGRETKILLGLLATLAGIFVGVLSMKLLVPRPPDGAGPDVHADVAATEPHDLVEPPQLVPADALLASTPAEPATTPAPRFEAAAKGHAVSPMAHDPFVARALLEQADTPLAPDDSGPPAELLSPAVAAAYARAEPSPAVGSTYVTRPGDSWWSVAERSYGDGRFYRALFAWNRAIDPRVSLVPGTSIEVPPAERLQNAWPALLPAH